MDVYQALADSTRRVILDELQVRDGRSLFDICTTLLTRHRIELTRQAISHHLNVLEDAGLVRTEKRGRVKFHFIDTRPLGEIRRRWPTSERGPSCEST